VAKLLRSPGPLVYHGSFYPLDPVVASGAALTVCTIHDMIPEMRGMRGRWADRYRSEKEAATRLADRVVSISESTSADLLRLMPWTAGKTHTIPNSTDLFTTRSSLIDPVYPKKHYFMMVGRRDDYKNGGIALRAFARLAHEDNRLGLVLCGGKQMPAEDQLVEELGISDRVKRIAPGDSWLRSHYEHALGLLYPSRHEGFGLPVLEAMLCGCPVVTTPLSSLPEVGGEAALYADADDLGEWVRCMKELLLPQRHALLSRRGIERAERFRPEVQAGAVLGLYRAGLAAVRA
jgi:glycosyltransferase involved in cell wall biosynthesis